MEFFSGAGRTFVYFDPSNVTLRGKAYVAQPEYNNIHHACATDR